MLLVVAVMAVVAHPELSPPRFTAAATRRPAKAEAGPRP
jgi:hypothetical protein